MNRLKQLRQEKGLTQEELSEALKEKGLYIAKQEIKAYEVYQPRMHNDAFWSRVANYFNVTLAYLMGDSKIPNEDYIVDLQDLIHREYELKLEKSEIGKGSKRSTRQKFRVRTRKWFFK
ncbi:DNA-binding helix-turn-helix protein [Streptococcus phage Str-PAP-1]|uniref:DNA-binding helix-turn-helix protein n=1 Tax=Streptococcus phage Str-PAP-1 TaxID=1589270 RepID=UPI000588E5C1|nr:DNA-binding helix-turn-helix protein [Streptococcus phage Str-PAP-1]AJD83076.1 DNA-binding helix-turn-helix protein [Streptococcus phage Str-PAP-1]